jgi:hypothetical protein
MKFRQRKKTIPDKTDFILGCDFADRRIKVDETVIAEFIKVDDTVFFERNISSDYEKQKDLFGVVQENKGSWYQSFFEG